MAIDSHEPQPSRRWGVWGCLLVAVCTTCLVPCGGFFAWSFSSRQRADAQLDRIRKAGEPTTPQELREYNRLNPGQTNNAELWLSGSAPLDTEEFRTASKDLPVVGEGPEIPPAGQPWPQQMEVEQLLEQYRESLEKFHEAARQGGHAVFDLRYEDGLSMTLNHAQSMRAGARLLKLEAAVRAHQGDSAGVVKSLQAMFAMSRALEREPVVISHLVAVAIYAIAVSDVREYLGTVDFTEQELKDLRTEVASFDLDESRVRGLIGERVMGIDVYRNPSAVLEDVPQIPMSMSYEDLGMYLELMDKFIDAARQPYPESLKRAEQVEAEMRGMIAGSPVTKLRYVRSLLLLPALSALAKADARTASYMRLADVSLAVKLFHQQHGRFPGRLAELVPQFLPSVPADPYTGEPFQYRSENAGFLVYSVGEDMRDDGGVEEENSTKPDIVFRIAK